MAVRSDEGKSATLSRVERFCRFWNLNLFASPDSCHGKKAARLPVGAFLPLAAMLFPFLPYRPSLALPCPSCGPPFLVAGLSVFPLETSFCFWGRLLPCAPVISALPTPPINFGLNILGG
jgi:hypothetical protein